MTLLVASLCGLIRAYGGFESILAFIRRVFRGKRGGQLGIGLLVGLMDKPVLCPATTTKTFTTTTTPSWAAPSWPFNWSSSANGTDCTQNRAHLSSCQKAA